MLIEAKFETYISIALTKCLFKKLAKIQLNVNKAKIDSGKVKVWQNKFLSLDGSTNHSNLHEY